MKTLSGYLSRKNVNDDVDLNEAASVSIKTASKEIQKLIAACNVENEKIMKVFVKEVQDHIKHGSPANVDEAIREWMKKNGKTLDSEITKDEFKDLFHRVRVHCWNYDGELVTCCDAFSMDEDSYDSIMSIFTKLKSKTFRNLGF